MRRAFDSLQTNLSLSTGDDLGMVATATPPHLAGKG